MKALELAPDRADAARPWPKPTPASKVGPENAKALIEQYLACSRNLSSDERFAYLCARVVQREELHDNRASGNLFCGPHFAAG